MLTEALRRLSSRAGPPFPAQPRTLQHLLTESSRPNASREDIVNAIEFDPAILANYLMLMPDLDDIAAWHDGWNADSLRTVALALAGLAAGDSTGQSPAHERAWARATRRGLLAAHLARPLELDPTTARLAAMLAEVGAWHTDETTPPSESLRAMNVSAPVCDAVRFASAAPESLGGSTLLVRLTAATHRLVDSVDGATPPVEQDHLGLDTAVVSDALAATSQSFLLAVARLAPPRPLAALIADAATGHFMYRSLSKHGGDALGPRISLIAKVLLGAPNALVLTCHSDALHAELADDAAIAVPTDHERSRLAAIYRDGGTCTLTASDLTLVAEQQIYGALGTSRIILGSLGTVGLLAIGWPPRDRPGRVRIPGTADRSPGRVGAGDRFGTG